MHVVSALDFIWYRKSPRNLGGNWKKFCEAKKTQSKTKAACYDLPEACKIKYTSVWNKYQ